MNVIVYDEKGLRHTLTLVHEILERPDDIAITYTDLSHPATDSSEPNISSNLSFRFDKVWS